MTQATQLEPILLVDSHHGTYMMQILASELLNDAYKYKGANITDIAYVADKGNMDNDDYLDAVSDLEQSLILFDLKGNEYTVQFNEDLWAVPEGYYFEMI